ncbi:TVP38/TMEM64 family protein [Hydrococcus rivularis NIES-593]|uniref:TVP38/TMEM64 family membrane protein n=2 Tax=Hydrococcus TaxID=1616833 RepID=A0A1U7H917_9CYAN|nr:TVP38/TMEM64 family protein [Hydrococcus rivularis NIES-593]
MTPPNQRRFYSKLKLIFISGLVAIAIAAAKYFPLQELLQTSLIQLKNLGFIGAIAFIAIYNLATLLFVPGSILTMKGGCLFGVFWGSVCVLIAATLGATWAFLLGRYLSRDWVCRQIGKNPKFQALDRAVGKEGWKIVLLTRLSPLFPFNLLNYAFGVTQVSLKDYILGSLGMIPGTVMYVYIGALASDLAAIDMSNRPTTTETQTIQWAIRIIGLIATIAVTIYTTRLAKKALDRSL